MKGNYITYQQRRALDRISDSDFRLHHSIPFHITFSSIMVAGAPNSRNDRSINQAPTLALFKWSKYTKW